MTKIDDNKKEDTYKDQHPILKEAMGLKDDLIAYRRHIHQHPEIGMELYKTAAFVKEELIKMGYAPTEISKNGILAIAGGLKPGKTLLLRGDMDALPIKEESDLSFKSCNEYMHACGHDFHTSMLLGAAKLLKLHENELHGTVKLMFQPGEEIILGAKEMIEAGVLENPKVDMALMIHLYPNLELDRGSLIIPHAGPTTLAADWFEIEILGKGGHGAMPHATIDPLNVAAHMHLALQSINSRETNPLDTSILTIGVMEGGDIGNVIPDKAVLKGTIRTFNEENRAFIHERLKDIAHHTAASFRASCQVHIRQGCPSIVSDSKVIENVHEALSKMLEANQLLSMDEVFKEGKILFSEDFSYITQSTPGAILLLSSGHKDLGYHYPLHHPKVRFDEEILCIGAAVHAQNALWYLRDIEEENK
jgi:hippurate hydrolase